MGLLRKKKTTPPPDGQTPRHVQETWRTCLTCNGQKNIANPSGARRCPSCNGRGEVRA